MIRRYDNKKKQTYQNWKKERKKEANKQTKKRIFSSKEKTWKVFITRWNIDNIHHFVTGSE